MADKEVSDFDLGVLMYDNRSTRDYVRALVAALKSIPRPEGASETVERLVSLWIAELERTEVELTAIVDTNDSSARMMDLVAEMHSFDPESDEVRPLALAVLNELERCAYWPETAQRPCMEPREPGGTRCSKHSAVDG